VRLEFRNGIARRRLGHGARSIVPRVSHSRATAFLAGAIIAAVKRAAPSPAVGAPRSVPTVRVSICLAAAIAIAISVPIAFPVAVPATVPATTGTCAQIAGRNFVAKRIYGAELARVYLGFLEDHALELLYFLLKAFDEFDLYERGGVCVCVGGGYCLKKKM
jgi:hypothetical protein